MKLTKLFVSALASLILLSACSQETKEFTYEKTDTDIDHIHGTGFAGDSLYIATHTGIMKYDGKNWYAATGNNHDYMGFSMIRDGFYSSGHPADGSKLKNPLGLIKSTDEGKTLDQLAFYGESDFHYLTAGFDSEAIYVINQEPNSELETGLYYTLDEGKTWESSKLSGIESDSIGTISTHPNKEEIIAISTKDGLYLSKDTGNNFELITENFMVPAVFMLDDIVLYSVLNDKGIHLYSQPITDGSTTEITIPDLADHNPIMFIAANHKNQEHMAIITYANDIFISKDGGKNWTNIAKKGKLD
ncbi:sialidase [Siminovitchia acidinfaciens]|uniref:Sialidase n=1 Tax=Siminovitchia acidinfaciens TaxID=2321395 RepID=A0A429Y3V9_9BACI|nr:sialidase [Siminovitchia acidinfaciens]RST76102.1 sialidase [Siminovitchia acidinfaciens]